MVRKHENLSKRWGVATLQRHRRAVAVDCLHHGGTNFNERTSGGVRYSIPILLLRFRELRTSFMSEYRSNLKLKVGPAGNRTSLKVGDFCVREKARRCVT